jgi:hypothetical protein
LRNIEAQRRDDRSLLHLYRELIALRRREPCLLHEVEGPTHLRPNEGVVIKLNR